MPQLIAPNDPVAIGIETSLIMATVGWVIGEEFSTGSIALVGISNMMWNVYIKEREKNKAHGVASPVASINMNENIGVSI